MYMILMSILIGAFFHSTEACCDRIFAIQGVSHGSTWEGEDLYTGYLHHAFLYAWKEGEEYRLGIDFMDDRGIWVSQNKNAAKKYFKKMESMSKENKQKEGKG